MNQIDKILEKIKSLLLEMGFEETVVVNPYRSETNYVRDSLYCIPQYVGSLGFLIEYAYSYENAKNHGHEDGDALQLSMGENIIIEAIKQEIQKNLNQ